MKAIALISGGLDSILAAKLLKQEGIDIIPLYFKIPFFIQGKTVQLNKTSSHKYLSI